MQKKERRRTIYESTLHRRGNSKKWVNVGMVRRKRKKTGKLCVRHTMYDMYQVYDEQMRCGASP